MPKGKHDAFMTENGRFAIKSAQSSAGHRRHTGDESSQHYLALLQLSISAVRDSIPNIMITPIHRLVPGSS